MSEQVSHVESKNLYIYIWIILLCFTALTTGVAFIDLGPLNTVAALAIAVCKAGLVVLFFMHARHSEKLVRVVIGVAIFWLLILIVITTSDFATRHLLPMPAWEKNQPTIVHHLTPGP
ncbi:MAG: cytochrome C oxidase subunit IV family protein [Terriglobia bacterium]